jgi:hypothetical protein
LTVLHTAADEVEAPLPFDQEDTSAPMVIVARHITADVVDPGRVTLSERWESQAAVNALRRSAPRNKQGAAILSASVAEYDIAKRRPLFGKGSA